MLLEVAGAGVLALLYLHGWSFLRFLHKSVTCHHSVLAGYFESKHTVSLAVEMRAEFPKVGIVELLQHSAVFHLLAKSHIIGYFLPDFRFERIEKMLYVIGDNYIKFGLHMA